MVPAGADPQDQVIVCLGGQVDIRYSDARAKGYAVHAGGVIVVNDVRSVACIEHIGVIASATAQSVIARIAKESIVTVTAVDNVVTSLAGQEIISCRALNGIIRQTSAHSVITGSAGEILVVANGNYPTHHQLSSTYHGAIGKSKTIRLVSRPEEPVSKHQLITALPHVKDQIII